MDVAHNADAWDRFLQEAEGQVTGPKVGVVALTTERSIDELASGIQQVEWESVECTEADRVDCYPSEKIVQQLKSGGVKAVASASSFKAFDEAFERAEASEASVLVFGSHYLVNNFLEWVDKRN